MNDYSKVSKHKSTCILKLHFQKHNIKFECTDERSGAKSQHLINGIF